MSWSLFILNLKLGNLNINPFRLILVMSSVSEDSGSMLLFSKKGTTFIQWTSFVAYWDQDTCPVIYPKSENMD